MERPMLGGCCVCLDERGWAENPLVYCDGQSCSVAVHQACYGIVKVPSGPWFCTRCEAEESTKDAKCELCPNKDGALKRTDNKGWAHVVCALYIPEVEFGNVSSMEPIMLERIPQDRFNKTCCICDDESRPKKRKGACMNCNKAGCKLSFHVTCAQMTGLLCEEAGNSNTTKYCGYCRHHVKHKKQNPFKSLSCSKVYKLSTTSSDEVPSPEKVIKPTEESEVIENVDVLNSDDSITPTSVEDTPKYSDTSGLTLSSLAEVATCAIEREQIDSRSTQKTTEGEPPDLIPSNKPKKADQHHSEKMKKQKQKRNSGDNSKKRPIKMKRPKTKDAATEESVAGEYAAAPKHSVVTLSAYGDEFMVASKPADIGGDNKPTMLEQSTDKDGLTAINELAQAQNDDLLQFFQEFGAPSDVSPLLKTLHHSRQANSSLQNSIEKMTQRRDQLLAIKARLSTPIKPQFNPTAPPVTESKPYLPPNQGNFPQGNYPYYINKH